ncbi:Ubiquitin-conjugating enzyme E2 [Macrophomina phaseolina MS6]|uniref:Ubiquitin-conjugating enzyme E2 n=1 Tax=Macrophomina phaseolina (strain MS6) TaxID=1126212 RepID=K2SAN8_MACPH|nr:Ubiquitin-conjugating enzyme E2 [Macrophomina phaseolina MS6]
MNSRSLRRLAGDHATLHADLPPNYFFAPHTDPSDELTQLDILLAGPEGTPYAAGLYKLHLEIPHTYPTSPPTAHFRTRIWHPNVEEATGAVCVDTLKRDWQASLTLRDVLVTISCLLIQPNPASALNAEAGALLQEDWEAFCRRARLMTGIHAQVPRELRACVEEAKMRGEEKQQAVAVEDARKHDAENEVEREDLERLKGKSKKRDANGSAVKGSAKGKARMAAAPEKMPAPAAEMEENVASRRESDDWIPALPSFASGTPALNARAEQQEADLILPDEVYAVIKQELDGSAGTFHYARVNMTLGELIDGEFFNHYIKTGNILMLSEGRRGIDNVFSLRDGVLRLELDRAMYERCGLEGQPIPHGGRKHTKERFAVELELRKPSMLHGKKGFERIVWAFKNVLNHSLTWLFHDVQSPDRPPSGSPLFFSSKICWNKRPYALDTAD